VPVFVVSRHAPPARFTQMPLVTYLDDVATAIGLPREAAGDRNVLVHGARIAQQALATGLRTSWRST
jgi:dihydrofolate reductase